VAATGVGWGASGRLNPVFWVSMFAALKMLAVYVVLGAVAGVIGIPYSLLVGNVRRLYRIVILGIMPWGVRAAGIEVLVSGRENIPPGVSCIFLANHVSNLDPPIILPQIPPMTSVLLKQELMRIPMLGTAMRMGKFVPGERSKSREAAKRSMEAAADALGSGLHMLVFGEGTRSKDGRLQPFKKGPFFLAQHTGAPIIPVAISGTERMMRKGSLAITPGVAQVQMLPPIYPRDFAHRFDLMRAVHDAIAGALPEHMRPSESGIAD
jgi:1-acyl-sn-glycerol-3-phosphate acyltransferase